MSYPTIEQLQSFFFHAMLNSGWIGGGKINNSTDMPGYKVVRFVDETEGLLLIDTWCSGDDGYSSGSTTIYMVRHEREGGNSSIFWLPVWTMTYMGRYDDEAITVVKAALRKTYQNGQFIGGRGPLSFEQNGWSYHSSIASHSSDDMFSFFAGTERVTNEGIEHGLHHFAGMILFNNK